MGIAERREREREEGRKKILDAARELFATEGYERVTMRRIAEAIEYSPTTIYLHMKIDGGGRVLDRFRDAAHGDALVPFGGEELPRGVQDLLPALLAFPLPPLRDPHLHPPPRLARVCHLTLLSIGTTV